MHKYLLPPSEASNPGGITNLPPTQPAKPQPTALQPVDCKSAGSTALPQPQLIEPSFSFFSPELFEPNIDATSEQTQPELYLLSYFFKDDYQALRQEICRKAEERDDFENVEFYSALFNLNSDSQGQEKGHQFTLSVFKKHLLILQELCKAPAKVDFSDLDLSSAASTKRASLNLSGTVANQCRKHIDEMLMLLLRLSKKFPDLKDEPLKNLLDNNIVWTNGYKALKKALTDAQQEIKDLIKKNIIKENIPYLFEVKKHIETEEKKYIEYRDTARNYLSTWMNELQELSKKVTVVSDANALTILKIRLEKLNKQLESLNLKHQTTGEQGQDCCRYREFHAWFKHTVEFSFNSAAYGPGKTDLYYQREIQKLLREGETQLTENLEEMQEKDADYEQGLLEWLSEGAVILPETPKASQANDSENEEEVKATGENFKKDNFIYEPVRPEEHQQLMSHLHFLDGSFKGILKRFLSLVEPMEVQLSQVHAQVDYSAAVVRSRISASYSKSVKFFLPEESKSQLENGMPNLTIDTGSNTDVDENDGILFTPYANHPKIKLYSVEYDQFLLNSKKHNRCNTLPVVQGPEKNPEQREGGHQRRSSQV